MTFHKTGGNMDNPGTVSGRKEDTTLADYINRKSMDDALAAPTLTFEDWCDEGQAMYTTIENKEDLYRVLKRTWQAAGGKLRG